MQEYSRDLKLRSAVERQFEILGEALNKLDHIVPAHRNEYPAIGNIIGMRNRIIHGYDSVDDDIIWDALTNHLPPLMDWLKKISM